MNPFRTPLVVANWKMNRGGRDACALAADVAARLQAVSAVEVVLAPPATALAAVAAELHEVRGTLSCPQGIALCGQNLHPKEGGAYTGEISAAMLADAGCEWVIVGHSERRQMFGDTDAYVEQKVDAAFDARLRPIVCVGETLGQREAGQTLEVVEQQVRSFMNHLLRDPGFGVIAYEPVWAIGTGKVASPEDAQEVHAKIRALLEEVSEEVAESTRILYGGSVKANNAAGLFAQDDIDGALVGGASLNAEEFTGIVVAAAEVREATTLDPEASATAAVTEPEGALAESAADDVAVAGEILAEEPPVPDQATPA